MRTVIVQGWLLAHSSVIACNGQVSLYGVPPFSKERCCCPPMAPHAHGCRHDATCPGCGSRICLHQLSGARHQRAGWDCRLGARHHPSETSWTWSRWPSCTQDCQVPGQSNQVWCLECCLIMELRTACAIHTTLAWAWIHAFCCARFCSWPTQTVWHELLTHQGYVNGLKYQAPQWLYQVCLIDLV